MPSIPIHPVYTTPPLAPITLGEVGRPGPAAIVRLAEGHPQHGRLRYLWPDQPPEALSLDALEQPCPPLDLLVLRDVQMRSDWMAYIGEAVVGGWPIYPAYVRDFYEQGHIDHFGYPKVDKVREILTPTFVVTHFNMRTYGHFLLEVLPKLLLVRELYRLGLRCRVAFPASMNTFIAITKAAFPEARLLIYDDEQEKLALKTALLPTLPLSPSGHLHDLALASLKLLPLRLAGAKTAPSAQTGRRLFLSREGRESFRVLANEAALAAIARRYGFEVLRPEDLPWADQVAAFAGASHVVGEMTSALHNTLFCSAAAKVISLNCMGATQSAIAAGAGHEIGYIMPVGGVDTSFVPNWQAPKRFEIDPEVFRQRLEEIGLQPTTR